MGGCEVMFPRTSDYVMRTGSDKKKLLKANNVIRGVNANTCEAKMILLTGKIPHTDSVGGGKAEREPLGKRPYNGGGHQWMSGACCTGGGWVKIGSARHENRYSWRSTNVIP